MKKRFGVNDQVVEQKSVKAAKALFFILVLWACRVPVRGETINGVVVPQEPNSQTSKSSIKGIDSNGNGIRDDVDRLIAKEFGTKKGLLAKAHVVASALQAAMENPTPERIKAYSDSIRCLPVQEMGELGKIENWTLDTVERRQSYANAFAGNFISLEGCE